MKLTYAELVVMARSRGLSEQNLASFARQQEESQRNGCVREDKQYHEARLAMLHEQKPGWKRMVLDAVLDAGFQIIAR